MKLNVSAQVFEMPIPYNPKFYGTLDVLAAKYDVDDLLHDFIDEYRKLTKDFPQEEYFKKVAPVIKHLEELLEELQSSFVVPTRSSSNSE